MKNTLLDVTKRTAGAKEVGLIEENLKYCPELAIVPVKTISGTSYTTVARTGLPSAGFTGVNQGVPASKSKYATKLVQCYPIRSAVEVDKALVSADSSASSLQADEASGVMEAVMRTVGTQFYYGRGEGGDENGHIGLVDVASAEQTLSAGGTTDETASSVYFVKFGRKDVQLVFGNNTTLKLPPFREETLTDGDGNKFDGMVSHLTGWEGIQCTNKNSVTRVCNLTNDAGKGLTDKLLAEALSMFPAGYQPDAIFMSRRSRRQLQEDRASKISLNSSGKKGDVGGGSAYAPTPTDFEGIKIVPTDSLNDTEKLVS